MGPTQGVNVKRYDFLLPGSDRWMHRHLMSDRIAILACLIGGFLLVTSEDDELLFINLPS